MRTPVGRAGEVSVRSEIPAADPAEVWETLPVVSGSCAPGCSAGDVADAPRRTAEPV